jgi:hypothetical protein
VGTELVVDRATLQLLVLEEEHYPLPGTKLGRSSLPSPGLDNCDRRFRGWSVKHLDNFDPDDRVRHLHSFAVQHALIVADNLADHHSRRLSDEAFEIAILGTIGVHDEFRRVVALAEASTGDRGGPHLWARNSADAGGQDRRHDEDADGHASSPHPDLLAGTLRS